MIRESWLTMWGTLLVCAPVVAFAYFAYPPNTFSLFCTYTSQYEIAGVLEVGNERITSTVATQRTVTRDWISVMNSAGCRQSHGTTMVFKASDDRVWLVDTRLCPIADEVLADAASVDLLKICKDPRQIYVIDGATNPSTWRRSRLGPGGEVRLVALKAVSTTKWPYDNTDEVAPNILKSAYRNSEGEWWDGPARLLPRPRSKALFEVRETGGSVVDGGLRGTVTQ